MLKSRVVTEKAKTAGYVKGNIYEATGTYILCTEDHKCDLLGVCICDNSSKSRLAEYRYPWGNISWELFHGTIEITS